MIFVEQMDETLNYINNQLDSMSQETNKPTIQ